jgi:hypothetical protein
MNKFTATIKFDKNFDYHEYLTLIKEFKKFNPIATELLFHENDFNKIIGKIFQFDNESDYVEFCLRYL